MYLLLYKALYFSNLKCVVTLEMTTSFIPNSNKVYRQLIPSRMTYTKFQDDTRGHLDRYP